MAKKPKLKIKLKEERKFLEQESDSYYHIQVEDDFGSKYVYLKLADCNRNISWAFGKPGNVRAIAKITAVKAMVDKVHAYLTQEVPSGAD